MNVEIKNDYLAAVMDTQADLERLARPSEAAIESAAQVFKALAGQAGTILKQAALIVGSVEGESAGTVLSKVQSLGLTVKDFLERRLEAAGTILETLKVEEKLLTQLTKVTIRQEAIASHLKELSVLTNVEVAQLGSVGGDFQILAEELSAFSNSIAAQTQELASHTESRTRTIGETRAVLAADLPRMRNEMSSMEDDIGRASQAIDASLNELARIPEQFNACAETTSQQIAGVVAAIQSHDITRQQIEHVQGSLQFIASKLEAETGTAEEKSDDGLSLAYAGLTIQVCQLKNIKETVANWTSQVRRCMGGIQELSASDVVRIGPVVLHQERELSSQLAHIELLRQKSQEYSGKIQNTLSGLSALLDLVNDHLGRSQSTRRRLRLLTFNSLIEANRLGARGAVVSSIANLIREVSAEWNSIADQSQTALSEILKLVKQTNEIMEVFSEASNHDLREGQAHTRAALDGIRGAAAFVARESAQVQTVMDAMQANLTTVGKTGDRLHECFANLDTALQQMERLAGQLERENPRLASGYDAAEVERLFSASYTTEIERHVLRAALHGTPMPVMETALTGNDVELF